MTKQTTIETDSGTLSYIKLYCNFNGINQKDFLKHILKKNKDYMNFVNKCGKLK